MSKIKSIDKMFEDVKRGDVVLLHFDPHGRYVTHVERVLEGAVEGSPDIITFNSTNPWTKVPQGYWESIEDKDLHCSVLNYNNKTFHPSGNPKEDPAIPVKSYEILKRGKIKR